MLAAGGLWKRRVHRCCVQSELRRCTPDSRLEALITLPAGFARHTQGLMGVGFSLFYRLWEGSSVFSQRQSQAPPVAALWDVKGRAWGARAGAHRAVGCAKLAAG